ncbi:transcriptional regulator [Lentilactobacillus diolivorans DSM 14421]|jgi:AcrR family transcriptional regulator|uniref:Transcriptional regulator n=2 Tax=Lentilactobacillus diolivorans TaxID=179838 RepID=A0A0R1S3M0_9LACO|nr:transcriptional regulator [Lentilactobacillus diolivorans DSM 14421]
MKNKGGSIMKYDLSKKPTRGAQRTLEAFSKTMLELLSQKSFEHISVNEICDISNFPRATFYNYFDDKYDLVDYCWYTLAKEIQVDKVTKVESDRALIVYFDRLYDIFDKNKHLLNNILQNNQFSGQLVNSFINYFKNTMQKIFRKAIDYSKYDLPVELMADHCSDTVLLVLEWIFLRQQTTTQEQAHKYLDTLLN